MSGRIRDEDIEEVRDKASLVEVAAEHLQLKKAGRLYKALCPFHTEKTPSFTIDPAKNLYFCHGCQKGGNVFNFLMELETISFAEAVERAAQKAGVTLHYERSSAADGAAAAKRKRLVETHRAAVEHYHGLLRSSDEAKAARAYLRRRGFTKETVEHFSLGFSSPKWDDLVKTLSKKGFSLAELVEAGLGSRTERGTVVDRFRGRLMFPIHDLTGQPIAFGARKLDATPGEGPKYLNSAESPIYKKGNVLYALHLAKSEIVKVDRALAVEGYTDVIALHQAGVREAVATCGTALGLEHFRLLRRFSEKAVLAFDSDAAGKAAAERAFEHVQQAGIEAHVLVLPDGRDPADLVLERGEEAGEAARALAEAALPIIEYRLDREAARFDVSRPEGQSRALRSCLPILASVEDEVVREKYAGWLSERIRVQPHDVFVSLGRMLATGEAPAPSDLKRVTRHAKIEREALKIALQFPDVGGGNGVEPDDFSVQAYRRIWAAMADGETDVETLSARLTDGTDRRMLTALAMEPREGIEANERVASEIFSRVKELSLARKIEELKSRLQKINPIKQRREYDSLFEELMSLEGARRRVSVAGLDGDAGGEGSPPGGEGGNA
jgi:DNA primase